MSTATANIPFEPRLEVWALVAALGAAYWWATTRLSARTGHHPRPATRKIVLFGSGLAVLGVAASWPLDSIGDDYLFSVHMLQYLLMALVAAPLLVAGTPGWLLEEVVHPLGGAVRVLVKPVVALIVFNGVLIVSHWPTLVALYARNDAVHFAMHVLWVLSGMVFWMPVFSPSRAYPRLSAPWQMGYLLGASLIPTLPASFLTWAQTPYYESYATAPRLWGISPIEDIQAAGAVMKLGGGVILWSIIAVIFFRWASAEDRPGFARSG